MFPSNRLGKALIACGLVLGFASQVFATLNDHRCDTGPPCEHTCINGCRGQGGNKAVCKHLYGYTCPQKSQHCMGAQYDAPDCSGSPNGMTCVHETYTGC